MLPDFKYIRNAANYNNKLYFVSENYDDLVEINIEAQWKIRSVCRFPWKHPKGSVECIVDGTKIWCIAMWGVQVASYDFINGCAEYFCEDEYQRENIAVMYFNRVLWILPRNLPDFLIGFSASDKTFCADRSWESCCILSQVKGQIMICSIEGDEALMVLKDTKKLIQFQLTDHSMKVHKIPIAENLYGVVRIGESVYLTVTDCKKIYVLTSQFEKIQEHKCTDSLDGQYYRPISIDNQLLLCDGHKLSVFVQGTFRTLEIRQIENSMKSFFFSGLKMGDRYFFLPWNTKQALETDLNFENPRTYKLPYSVEPIEHWIRRLGIVSENEISLQDYLLAVSELSEENMEKEIECEIAGETIYRTCI